MVMIALVRLGASVAIFSCFFSFCMQKAGGKTYPQPTSSGETPRYLPLRTAPQGGMPRRAKGRRTARQEQLKEALAKLQTTIETQQEWESKYQSMPLLLITHALVPCLLMMSLLLSIYLVATQQYTGRQPDAPPSYEDVMYMDRLEAEQ